MQVLICIYRFLHWSRSCNPPKLPKQMGWWIRNKDLLEEQVRAFYFDSQSREILQLEHVRKQVNITHCVSSCIICPRYEEWNTQCLLFGTSYLRLCWSILMFSQRLCFWHLDILSKDRMSKYKNHNININSVKIFLCIAVPFLDVLARLIYKCVFHNVFWYVSYTLHSPWSGYRSSGWEIMHWWMV